MSSGHDECLWRRCPYRAWKSEDKGKQTGGMVNDTIIIRLWVHSVNTFCLRGFDEKSRRLAKRRLQLYNLVLNMSSAKEREFWLTHEEAFRYPRLNIEGGDKFAEIFKKHEIARYRVNAYSHQVKLELGLDPAKPLNVLLHETNIQYRARWPENVPVKKVGRRSGPPALESVKEPAAREENIKGHPGGGGVPCRFGSKGSLCPESDNIVKYSFCLKMVSRGGEKIRLENGSQKKEC